MALLGTEPTTSPQQPWAPPVLGAPPGLRGWGGSRGLDFGAAATPAALGATPGRWATGTFRPRGGCVRERWHGRGAGEAAAGCGAAWDGGLLVLGWRSWILGASLGILVAHPGWGEGLQGLHPVGCPGSRCPVTLVSDLGAALKLVPPLGGARNEGTARFGSESAAFPGAIRI